jgi:hypothetical protein
METGSVRAARSAGIRLAKKATTASSAVVIEYVPGSVGEIP